MMAQKDNRVKVSQSAFTANTTRNDCIHNWVTKIVVLGIMPRVLFVLVYSASLAKCACNEYARESLHMYKILASSPGPFPVFQCPTFQLATLEKLVMGLHTHGDKANTTYPRVDGTVIGLCIP